MFDWKTLSKARDGNFAVIVALAAVPLVMSVGGAVDYGRFYAEKSKVRDSLDAAVIAGIKSPPGQEVEVARKFFLANMGSSGASYVLNVAMKNDDVLTANATGRITTPFLGITNVKTLGLNVGVEVSRPKISSVTFTPINAQGWFSKDIFIFTKDRSGNVLMSKPVISYDFDQKTQKKTIVPPLNSAGETIKLGTSYDTFGVGMVVWEDYVNGGRKLVKPKTFYSDAADASKYIQRDGDCLTAQFNHWEDGGNKDYRDFEYKLTCETSMVKVYLTQ